MDKNVQVQGKQTNRAPQDGWWWRRKRELIREEAKQIRRAKPAGSNTRGFRTGRVNMVGFAERSFWEERVDQRGAKWRQRNCPCFPLLLSSGSDAVTR